MANRLRASAARGRWWLPQPVRDLHLGVLANRHTVGADEGPHGPEHLGPLALVERGDEADRRDAVNQSVGVEGLLVGKYALLERPEQLGALEGGPPGARVERGRVAAVRGDELLDRAVQRVVHLPAIPDKSERATGAQHAMDLGQGRVAVKPMEGLCYGDSVGARGG